MFFSCLPAFISFFTSLRVLSFPRCSCSLVRFCIVFSLCVCVFEVGSLCSLHSFVCYGLACLSWCLSPSVRYLWLLFLHIRFLTVLLAVSRLFHLYFGCSFPLHFAMPDVLDALHVWSSFAQFIRMPMCFVSFLSFVSPSIGLVCFCCSCLLCAVYASVRPLSVLFFSLSLLSLFCFAFCLLPICFVLLVVCFSHLLSDVTVFSQVLIVFLILFSVWPAFVYFAVPVFVNWNQLNTTSAGIYVVGSLAGSWSLSVCFYRSSFLPLCLPPFLSNLRAFRSSFIHAVLSSCCWFSPIIRLSVCLSVCRVLLFLFSLLLVVWVFRWWWSLLFPVWDPHNVSTRKPYVAHRQGNDIKSVARAFSRGLPQIRTQRIHCVHMFADLCDRSAHQPIITRSPVSVRHEY